MLFSQMMRQGTFYNRDPEVLAMNYYSPIYFLLSKYNGRTEEVEEALEILDKQIAEFYRIYKIN